MSLLANIELLGSSTCPYVQRSVALLVQHRIPFSLKVIDLQNKPQWFLERSPLGKVPALLIGNDYLFESQVINEFIEDNLPVEQRITPTDPLIRAQNKAWIEFGSGLLGDVFGALSKTTKEEFEVAHTNLKNKFTQLDAQTTNFKGPYFNGDKPALIDLAWGPIGQIFLTLDIVLGIDLGDKAKHPKIYEWIKKVAYLPSVLTAIQLQQQVDGLDSKNPESYINHDNTNALEHYREKAIPSLSGRFANSYAYKNAHPEK